MIDFSDGPYYIDHTRPCMYRVVERYDMGKPIYSEWRSGRFHAWSQSHIESEEGPGHFPVGIVHDASSGKVFVVEAAQVHFGDPFKDDHS